jgi:hypothetical protein
MPWDHFDHNILIMTESTMNHDLCGILVIIYHTQTIRKSITIWVRRRMRKIRHGDLILTVWQTATNLASQIYRMAVREARHRSITAVPKPEVHLARSVVTDISVIAPVPSASDHWVRLSDQWLSCQSSRVTVVFVISRGAHDLASCTWTNTTRKILIYNVKFSSGIGHFSSPMGLTRRYGFYGAYCIK